MTNLHTQDVVPSAPSYRFIPLTKNQIAVVDAADFDWINQWQWRVLLLGKKFYAVRRENGVLVYMHRLIANTPDDLVGDHWNGDTLDNRRCNLRNMSQDENKQSISLSGKSSTGHTRISVHHRKFRVRMSIDNKETHVGLFKTIEDAVQGRNEAIRNRKKYSRLEAPEIISRPENVPPRALRLSNSSGFYGVYRKGKKWQVALRIDSDKRLQHFGTFDYLDEAVAERNRILGNLQS